MKKIIIILCMLFCINTFSQNTYHIKFNNISNVETSKHAIELIKTIFNETPIFNDQTDLFVFKSYKGINKQKFEAEALGRGFIVNYYSVIIKLEISEIKEE